MQNHTAKSTKNVIYTAHVMDVLNEKDMAMETIVKVKGSLMNTGIESWFSCVLSAKKMPVSVLKEYGETKLRNLSAKDEALGYKHVFQTDITKETINERIRSPLGMWEESETFIDNDVQLVIDKLHQYYE